jgi:hypothetical protein
MHTSSFRRMLSYTRSLLPSSLPEGPSSGQPGGAKGMGPSPRTALNDASVASTSSRASPAKQLSGAAQLSSAAGQAAGGAPQLTAAAAPHPSRPGVDLMRSLEAILQPDSTPGVGGGAAEAGPSAESVDVSMRRVLRSGSLAASAAGGQYDIDPSIPTAAAL